MPKLPNPLTKRKNVQRAPKSFPRFQSDMFTRVRVRALWGGCASERGAVRAASVPSYTRAVAVRGAHHGPGMHRLTHSNLSSSARRAPWGPHALRRSG